MSEDLFVLPRVDQERTGKIRLHPSGRFVNPLDLRPEDVDIWDIAHHLSNICRYTGACPAFYSVAQHSVYVAQDLRDSGAVPDLVMAGLLHDAAEYVFNDLASPVKRDPRMQWYRDMEHEATRLIYRVFGLDPELLAQTKPADDAVFHREVATWWGGGYTGGFIHPWHPVHARNVFMEHFISIQSARDLWNKL